MSDINVVQRTQRIVVDPASASVSVINAGPQGPAGPAGADGVGAGSDTASGTSFIPPTGMTSTNVQDALVEIWQAMGSGQGGIPLVPTIDIVTHRELDLGYAERRPGGLTGGFNGTSYVVTSLANSGVGTLRDALSAPNRYITFDPTIHGGTITLSSSISCTSDNITIDAVGANITITANRIIFESCDNNIIMGIRFRNPGNQNDMLTYRNYNKVKTMYAACYYCTFTSPTSPELVDSCIDIIYKGQHNMYITVAGCEFSYANRFMLIHSGEETIVDGTSTEGNWPNAAGAYYVSLIRNWIHHCYERLPFGRDFHLHMVNNVVEQMGRNANKSAGVSMGDAKNPPVGFQNWGLMENNVARPYSNGELDMVGTVINDAQHIWGRPSAVNDNTPVLKFVGTYLKPAATGLVPAETPINATLAGTPPYTYQKATANDALYTFIKANVGYLKAVRTNLTPTRPIDVSAGHILVKNGELITTNITDDVDVTSATVQFNGANVGTLTKISAGVWTATMSNLPLAGSIGTFRAVATTLTGPNYSPSYPALVI